MAREVVHTIAAAGDYTSLEAWRDAQARDLVAADEIAVAEIGDDFGALGLEAADFNPAHSAWVTDTDHPIVIRAAADAYRFGDKSAGARLHLSSGSAVLLFDAVDQVVALEGLTIMATEPFDRALKIQNNGPGFQLRVARCTISAQRHYVIYVSNVQVVGRVLFEVCLLEQVDRSKEIVFGIKSLPFEFVNTVFSGGLQVDASSGSLTNVTAKNTVAVGQERTPPWNPNATLATGSTNNAAQGGDTSPPPGANPLIADITAADFVDLAAGDVHLATGSPLRGAGANLAADHPGLLDIDLTAYPAAGPWDIGADAAASTPVDIPLAGAAVVVATADGTLATSIPLDGVASSVTSADGRLETRVAFSGRALAHALAAAQLTTVTSLAGDAVALADGAGDLGLRVHLQGAALATTLAGASLTPAAAGLSGAASASAGAEANLTTVIPLQGAAASATSADGALTTRLPLTGAAASCSTAVGTLDLEWQIEGGAVAQATGSGELTTHITLDASAVASAAAAGALTAGEYRPAAAARTVRVPQEQRVMPA